jgi:hypothetical protein
MSQGVCSQMRHCPLRVAEQTWPGPAENACRRPEGEISQMSFLTVCDNRPRQAENHEVGASPIAANYALIDRAATVFAVDAARRPLREEQRAALPYDA